jgi:hypothetical protein
VLGLKVTPFDMFRDGLVTEVDADELADERTDTQAGVVSTYTTGYDRMALTQGTKGRQRHHAIHTDWSTQR